MSTPRRTRRWPWLLLGAAGLAPFAFGVVGATAQTAPPTVVDGLDAVAVSDGMGQIMGDPNSQPYPVAKGDVAHTEATLSAGPTGYALASTAWPGPVAGNAGSLAVLLGAPPQAGAANYGGRAEAFSGGPNDAELPGMTAHAKDGVAEAIAGAQDFEDSGGTATGDVQTRSFAEFDDTTLRAVSSCTASDVSFGEGVVTIGSVRTEAEATTDGATSAAGGRTIVSGMKVGGQDATVDEDGVRFTDPATQPVGDQILSNMGISMFVAAPRTTQEPSSASHRAGSLVVIWDPPGTDYGYTYSICGSDSAVALRLGEGFQPLPDLVLPVSAPSIGFDDVATPTDPQRPVVETATPAARPSTPEVVTSSPIGFVRDLAVWPYVVGTLSVIAAGIGLRRAQGVAVSARAPVVCPLEGVQP